MAEGQMMEKGECFPSKLGESGYLENQHLSLFEH